MRIPPHKFKIMLESNPPKSRILVRRLAVFILLLLMKIIIIIILIIIIVIIITLHTVGFEHLAWSVTESES